MPDPPKPQDLELKPFFQQLLDWVDQPPPTRGRDTHAIQFSLFTNSAPSGSPPGYLMYGGLMFFRPRNTGHGPVGSLPGLTGVGQLLARHSFSSVGQVPNAPSWVKVDVMFRLPEVFAYLNFREVNNTLDYGMPETSVRTVEVDARIESPSSDAIILEARPEYWLLRHFEMTTVLYGL